MSEDVTEDNNSDANTDDLVIVSSSSSGIETLSAMVANLPPNLAVPIILAQPIDRNRPNNISTTLQRYTNYPIHNIFEGRASLESGQLYIVPSNRAIKFSPGQLEIVQDGTTRPRPTIDLLMAQAAEIYRDRLVVVILTWSSSDGAAGAVEVKNNGGTIIVQNPTTARYSSMPLTLPPTVVDFVSDVDRIGFLLQDLSKNEALATSETPESTDTILRNILDQISYRSSLDFRAYKTSTILRRIGRRITVTHQRTMSEYAQYLETHPEEVGELVKAFLINVTQFFRDPDAFLFLKNEILPQLINRAKGRDRVLRFWSAGCATGEEPYSLAMLLSDLLGAELAEWSIKIFATDLDEAAINFARRGLYSENHLKSVPDEYIARYFEQVDHGYRISKMLRQMVIFGQQDLSRSAPFPRIDFVLCRNVLIYFTAELQDFVLNQFAFSLSPNGYLFLGKAETVRLVQPFYELVNKHWKIYQCIGANIPLSRRQNMAELSIQSIRPSRLVPSRVSEKPFGETAGMSSPLENNQLRPFNELLLRFLPVGVVVIDRYYHLVTANGAARRIFGLREAGNEQDFLHAVRGIPYAEVRTAIDRVFREHNNITLPEVELSIVAGGNGRFVSLSLATVQMEAGSPDLAVISVSDVTEQVQIRRQLENMQIEQNKLMNELSSANQRLNDMNKELLDSNEELQVANEELVLTHEELQATIEEFETTNEELQATNEELETNNEELQATNEELQTTNEELRARTAELQELASTFESERVTLAEIVEQAPFYVMVLRGSNLLIEAFNPRYSSLLENRRLKGRPLEEIYELFGETTFSIVRLAREVYRIGTPHTTRPILNALTLPSTSQIGEIYFVFTIVPSHDSTGKINGVIIYATDETVKPNNDKSRTDREKL